MDDLKKYLNQIAKYSFWIISGLVLLLSSVIFYLTSTSMYSSISQRISTINGVFSKINEVGGKTATHPNELSHAQMEKRLEGLVSDVDQAWQFQYERQKEFLTWPQNAFQYPKVHEIFDGLRPFEKKVAFPIPEPVPAPLDQITVQDRKVYKDYIEPEFPALAKRIGSSWKFVLDQKAMAQGAGGFEPPGGGPFGPGGTGPAGASKLDETKDLVRWSESSQKELITTAMPWYSRSTPPTIHEIYYTQEDIWILRGLMDILANTNSEAKENFQAVVREIEWIRWGSKASRDAGALSGSGAAAGGMGGMMGGMMGGGPPSDYSGGGGGGPPAGYGGAGAGGKGGSMMPAGAARAKDPAEGRYVDTSFKPLTGTQLRGAMNLQNANDAVIAVAKRIPVRMRLKIDESQLGRLITECGNGKMMLEVLQVRYNTESASSGGAAGSAGGAGGAGGEGEGSMPGLGAAGAGGSGAELRSDGDEPESGEGGGMPSMGGPGGGSSNKSSNGEVPIEIFGLVYLFNPPANLSGTKTTDAANAASANGAPLSDAAAVAPPGPDAANAPAANPPAATPPAENPENPAVDPSSPAAPGAVSEPGSSSQPAGDPAAPGVPPPPADPNPPVDPSTNPPTNPPAGNN